MSRVAVIAVSRAGSALAVRIATALPEAEAHVPRRFLDGSRLCPEPVEGQELVIGYDGRVTPLVGTLFSQCDALVLVMAIGAAVRLIGPYLRDKAVDPAVVAADDAGRFAISLIGGHAAGANRLAGMIASAIDATPVLTTATEPSGAPDIEGLADGRGWRLARGSSLTRLLAALVNGESVGVFQDAGDRGWLASLPSHVQEVETMEALTAGRWDAALLVTDRARSLAAPLTARTAVFHPPVLVLGIGCSRGAAGTEIAALIDATLEREGLSPRAVAAVATIDRRGDEPGLQALLAERGWPLCLRTAIELATVKGDWTRSEVVRRAVGTPGVAEPAALAVAGVEQLTVRKVKSAHATLAIARAPVEIFADGRALLEEMGQ